jgi:Uma2 family endonuclease
VDAAGCGEPAGLVCAGYAVHEYDCDCSERNRGVGVADVYAGLYECVGVCGGIGGVSSGQDLVDVEEYNYRMSVVLDQSYPPRAKRWTKREYLELVKRGVFEGQRIYLFRGELIETSPRCHPAAYAITELDDISHLLFGIRQGFRTRVQLPFNAPGESMPEPAVLICTVEQSLYAPHPTQAVLVIEVADGSLENDREKGLEYAAAGIPEYWIVDLKNRQVEVYRDPIPDPTTQLGFRYSPPRIATLGESLEPLAKPGSFFNVSELFFFN